MGWSDWHLIDNLSVNKNWMVKFNISSYRDTMEITSIIVQQISCNFSCRTLATQNSFTNSIWSQFSNFSSRIIRSVNFLIKWFKNAYHFLLSIFIIFLILLILIFLITFFNHIDTRSAFSRQSRNIPSLNCWNSSLDKRFNFLIRFIKQFIRIYNSFASLLNFIPSLNYNNRTIANIII